MATIDVYLFDVFSASSMRFLRSEDYAPLETIRAFNAIPVKESRLDVDVEVLGFTGILTAESAQGIRGR